MSKKNISPADPAFEWWTKSKENSSNREAITLAKVGQVYRTYGQDALAISARTGLMLTGNFLEFSAEQFPTVFETMTRLGYVITARDTTASPVIPNNAEYELARKAFAAARELDRRSPVFGLTICFNLTPSMAMAVPDTNFYLSRTSDEIWLIGTPLFTPFRRNLEIQFKEYGDRLGAKYCAKRVLAYSAGNATEVSVLVNNLAASAMGSNSYAAIITSKGMSEKLVPDDLNLDEVVPLDGKHEMLFFSRSALSLEITSAELDAYKKANCYDLLPRDGSFKSSSAKTGPIQVVEIDDKKWLVYGGSYQGGIEDPAGSGKRISRENITAHMVIPVDGPGNPGFFGWHCGEGCIVRTDQGWMRITGFCMELSHKKWIEKPVVVVDAKKRKPAALSLPAFLPQNSPPALSTGQMNLF